MSDFTADSEAAAPPPAPRRRNANLGATDLARVCTTLATRTATGDLTGVEALVATLEIELERVRRALGAQAVAA